MMFIILISSKSNVCCGQINLCPGARITKHYTVMYSEVCSLYSTPWPVIVSPQNQIQIFFSALIEGTDWVLTLVQGFDCVGTSGGNPRRNGKNMLTPYSHPHKDPP